MKRIKKCFKLFVVLLMIFPLLQVRADDNTNNGFQLVTGDSVSSENTVNGSAVEAGNTVDSNNTINGVAVLLGNKVDFDGKADYSLFAGNIINLKGTINNDALVAGNSVTFDENFKINRDLFVFANQVTLNGGFDRDVTIYANTVTIEGVIEGVVSINASTVNVKEGTVINGTLKYNKDAEYNEENNTAIAKIEQTDEINVEMGYSEHIIYTLRNLTFMLVIFLVLALLVPELFKRIEKMNKDINLFKGLSLMGFGALTLIALPIVAILLISLYFGLPLAVITLILYGIAIYLSNIFTGYLLGDILWKKYIKREYNLLLVGLLGIGIIYILELIPFINTLVSIISLLIGIGIVINLFKKTA